MTITATAPVPAQCRISTGDTFAFPRLDRLSVTESAELFNVSPWVAFSRGARIRTEADVDAVAATMPPLSPEQVDELDRWCSRVAIMPIRSVQELWGCSLATAEAIRDVLGRDR